MSHRLMLVANRTCPCPGLPDEVGALLPAQSDASIHIVAPALNSRLKRWMSDEDEARAAAHERLALALHQLSAAGFQTSGEIGDAHPLVAIEDALVSFDATALLISTWPDGKSNWLERNLLDSARSRFAIPVHHVVSAYDAPVLATA